MNQHTGSADAVPLELWGVLGLRHHPQGVALLTSRICRIYLQDISRLAVAGRLWSDAKRIELGLDCHVVGMSTIKQRRLEKIVVTCHFGTTVGQYALFYFCPRSIMLYILHRGNSPDINYAEGQRLETDAAFNAGYGVPVVRGYRKVLRFVRSATDERDFRAMRSSNFEKFQGERKHQHSLRINDQWRLIIEIKKAEPRNVIVIVGIEDYH